MAKHTTSQLARFSDKGPVPRPLEVGTNLAVLLLCLQAGQELRAPASDGAETVFTVLAGDGQVVAGDETHAVGPGDVVVIAPGAQKSLLASGDGFTVVGVRLLGGKRDA